VNSRGVLHTRLLTRRDHAQPSGSSPGARSTSPEDQLGGPGWHHDEVRHDLGVESPGDPEPDGRWEVACRLGRDYEFAAPEIIRAVHWRSAPLLGRDMLLKGRFLGLRFLMGCGRPRSWTPSAGTGTSGCGAGPTTPCMDTSSAAG
jgi:hypothetical protein